VNESNQKQKTRVAGFHWYEVLTAQKAIHRAEDGTVGGWISVLEAEEVLHMAAMFVRQRKCT
jgi:hypothetical protein